MWTILGLAPGATADEIKRAFRARALATHPDHGGDPQEFRAVHQAYKKALTRRTKSDRKPKPRAK